MRWASRIALACALLAVAFLAILAWPDPLFTYRHSDRNFEVLSDRPIAREIAGVLDDADRRLRGPAR